MEAKVNQLINKLKADKKFAERLFCQETPEEAQIILSEEGFDFSIDEIKKIKDTFTKVLGKGADGELSDDELESVAGGNFGEWLSDQAQAFVDDMKLWRDW